eukprot:2485863-Amphidinium_carterae.1
MISGKRTFVLRAEPLLAGFGGTTESVLDDCCQRLGLSRRGRENLVHGNVVIPPRASVRDFPGLRPLGEISEYQLVV